MMDNKCIKFARTTPDSQRRCAFARGLRVTLGDVNIEGRKVVRAYPRERFSSEVALSPAMVVEFAKAAGDNNPIHHDPEFAATTRFGRPTASGPHTTALLLALTASHFSKKGAMLGLEFWVRFRRPIYADETIRLEWMVIKVTPNQKLRGEIVDLRGRIRGQDGKTSLGAKGRVLVTDQL
jgi:3-hydroxybutyryl-CoA dehydratase